MQQNKDRIAATNRWRGSVRELSVAQSDVQIENAQLRLRLAECEVIAARHATLLNEADHRIKNSLQLVASLLRLQARKSNGVNTSDALNAAAHRISAISSIHDALQTSAGVDAVDLGDMLRTMCNLQHRMAGEPQLISVIVEADPITAPVALAQPLLLAVNELVVNALRHAFHDGQAGVVEVSAHVVLGELRIVVSDDGVGLPPDHTGAHGFGSKLVDMMITKVGGTKSLDNSSGARFTILVPDSEKLVIVPPAAFPIPSDSPFQMGAGGARGFGALGDFAPPVWPTAQTRKTWSLSAEGNGRFLSQLFSRHRFHKTGHSQRNMNRAAPY